MNAPDLPLSAGPGLPPPGRALVERQPGLPIPAPPSQPPASEDDPDGEVIDLRELWQVVAQAPLDHHRLHRHRGRGGGDGHLSDDPDLPRQPDPADRPRGHQGGQDRGGVAGRCRLQRSGLPADPIRAAQEPQPGPARDRPDGPGRPPGRGAAAVMAPGQGLAGRLAPRRRRQEAKPDGGTSEQAADNARIEASSATFLAA